MIPIVNLSRLVGMMCVALLLSACATQSARLAFAPKQIILEGYQLDSGDQIRVIVFGQDDLSNIYRVEQSGFISFPLVGNIAARGHTILGMERVIAEKLAEEHLRAPDVSVEIAVHRPIFVMGEVNNAGQFAYVEGMSAQKAIAIAGGFSNRADKREVLITRQINGEIFSGWVPLTDPVRPGDTLHVKERFF